MNANAVTLTGTFVAIEPLRHTPAGLPLVSFKLAHASEQTEAGLPRKVTCEIDGIAIGEPAATVSVHKPGDIVNVNGFLARKDRMNPKLILHIIHIEKDN